MPHTLEPSWTPPDVCEPPLLLPVRTLPPKPVVALALMPTPEFPTRVFRSMRPPSPENPMPTKALYVTVLPVTSAPCAFESEIPPCSRRDSRE